MAPQASIQFGKIAVRVDPSEIIRASQSLVDREVEITLERAPIAPPRVPSITVPGGIIPTFTPFVPAEKKRLIVNIETTGLRPWKHRIIAIGLQDPLVPNELPIVIMLDSEEEMIRQLFTFIQNGGYNELIGYGFSFDHRFIYIKGLKFQIGLKEWVKMTIFDTMQLAAQVKMAFVYKAQQPPKLSELADYLWGFPKRITDIEMIKLWAQGQFEPVLAFTSAQVTRILALYLTMEGLGNTLFSQLTSGPSLLSAPLSPPDIGNTLSLLTIPEANSPETWTAKCPVDLSEHEVPITQEEFKCPIDGTVLKRPA